MRLSNSARITQPASKGQDENPVPPKKAELITCYPHTAANTQARLAKCKFRPVCRVTWGYKSGTLWAVSPALQHKR